MATKVISIETLKMDGRGRFISHISPLSNSHMQLGRFEYQMSGIRRTPVTGIAFSCPGTCFQVPGHPLGRRLREF